MAAPPDLHTVDFHPSLTELAISPLSLKSRRSRSMKHLRSSPESSRGLHPRIHAVATLPVCQCRRTHLVTLLYARPKDALSSCADMPSFSSAATTRSRRSIDEGLPTLVPELNGVNRIACDSQTSQPTVIPRYRPIEV